MDLHLVSSWSDLNFELWNSPKSFLLVNKFWTPQQLQDAKDMTSSYDSSSSLVWVASSGSSQSLNQSFKLFGLTRNSLLSSARAVNEHLSASSGDRWLSPLPVFHVGGLSTFVRSIEIKSEFFFLESWDVKEFLHALEKNEVAYTSLVPTQLFDLVNQNRKAPVKLKAVIVGGAKLEESLYSRARALGWPILPSFGMTEVGSQLATAELKTLKSLQFPNLKILSHIKATTDTDSNLFVTSPALFSVCLQIVDGLIQIHLPTQPYQTSDRAQINGDFINPLGRSQRFIKVLGEGVQLDDLQSQMALEFSIQGHLISIPEDRRGAQLIWVTGPHQITDHQLTELVQKWNSQKPGHYRLSAWIELEKIPLSPLGKPLYGEIEKSVAARLRQNI